MRDGLGELNTARPGGLRRRGEGDTFELTRFLRSLGGVSVIDASDTDSPERDLAISVIAIAAHDCARGRGGYLISPEEYKSAFRWMRERAKLSNACFGFRWVCQLLDIDARETYRKIESGELAKALPPGFLHRRADA